MAKTNANDPIDPTTYCLQVIGGLTKREYFALHALIAAEGNANEDEYKEQCSSRDVAARAVLLADKLIEKLNEEQK